MRWLINYLPVYRRPFWRGQLIALVTVCVSLLIRASVDPFIERGLYFNFLFPSILIAGLFGGIWSGATTALLGGLLSAYIWIPPKFDIAFTGEGIFRLVTFWALAAMMVVVTSFVHIVLDRLATAEVRAKTVASEMKHRVQNNLTLVQAIVRQTFQNSDNLAQAQKLLTARLAALTRAHELIELADKDISMEKLVGRALEPFDAEQFSLAGPSSVIVPQDFALSLMLLIHELATNAAKYGALSRKRGNIEITWQVSGDIEKSVGLIWQERGGPTIKARASTGFGTKLIDHVISHDLDGRTKTDFDPTGLRWTIAFPVGDLVRRGAAASNTSTA